MYLACKSERPGKLCKFWMKNKKYPDGVCTFNDNHCSKIVDRCGGCKYIEKTDIGDWCLVYMNPSIVWEYSSLNVGCPMYVNPEEIQKKIEEEKKINPLKVSKRAKKGRKIV